MTLEQLRIFLEVARQEHVTQAAHLLNLTQSSVSAALQALEERHGVALFERRGRRIALTAEGRLFIPAAEAVLAEARAAVQMLSDFSGAARGHLRIFSSQTIATQWLPARLVRFRSRYPGITVDLQVGNTQHCVASVQEGSCDLAFIEARGEARSLEETEVGADRLALLVGRGHPWLSAPPQTLQALRGSRWVLREAGSGTRKTFEDALRREGMGLEDLQILLELPGNEALCAAVSESDLATAVSYAVAEPYIAAGRLVELPLGIAPRPFYMIRNPARRVSHALGAFQAIIAG